MNECKPVIEKDELITLIPHKGKMVLLSRITAYNTTEHWLRSKYDVDSDCMFYDPRLGGIPSWLCFEFMAQSISALSGITGRENGRTPKVGFILSVSNMEIKVPVFKKETTVGVEVREDCIVNEVFTFNCRVFLNDESAATAKLTVMEVNDFSLLENRR